MASLNNLYISQSYQGLIHFSSNTASVAQLGLIEDGLGNSLGLFLNNNGDLKTTTSISSSRIEATNLIIKNKIELTGSIDIDGPVTASTAFIEGDLVVSGTLHAYEIVTLIESASVIFSSGSNILGDSTADVQTLNGTVIISGSAKFTGSLQVSNDISSSTLNGMGNVTLFSQSVDSRLDFLEGPFSTSVDSRLDVVEATASLYVPFSQSVDSRLDIVEATASLYVPFSQSVDNRLDGLEATASYLNTTFSQSVDFRLDELENWSSSLQTNFVTTAELTQTASFLQNQIDQKLFTASFNTYTQSVSNTIATLATTASLNNLSSSVATSITNLSSSVTTTITNVSSSISGTIAALSTSIQITDNAQTVRIDGLASFTGSYATTGSNIFRGNQTITGSLILSSSAAIELTTIGNSVFSGSVRGQVFPITINSNTASMDCNLGNFFTVTLPAGPTRFEATNIQPGETLSLRILNASSGSQFTGSASVKFPNGFSYVPTTISGSTDIITFLTFDNTAIFAVAANYFV